jgi:hypothetical protein
MDEKGGVGNNQYSSAPRPPTTKRSSGGPAAFPERRPARKSGVRGPLQSSAVRRRKDDVKEEEGGSTARESGGPVAGGGKTAGAPSAGLLAPSGRSRAPGSGRSPSSGGREKEETSPQDGRRRALVSSGTQAVYLGPSPPSESSPVKEPSPESAPSLTAGPVSLIGTSPEAPSLSQIATTSVSQIASPMSSPESPSPESARSGEQADVRTPAAPALSSALSSALPWVPWIPWKSTLEAEGGVFARIKKATGAAASRLGGAAEGALARDGARKEAAEGTALALGAAAAGRALSVYSKVYPCAAYTSEETCSKTGSRRCSWISGNLCMDTLEAIGTGALAAESVDAYKELLNLFDGPLAGTSDASILAMLVAGKTLGKGALYAGADATVGYAARFLDTAAGVAFEPGRYLLEDVTGLATTPRGRTRFQEILLQGTEGLRLLALGLSPAGVIIDPLLSAALLGSIGYEVEKAKLPSTYAVLDRSRLLRLAEDPLEVNTPEGCLWVRTMGRCDPPWRRYLTDVLKELNEPDNLSLDVSLQTLRVPMAARLNTAPHFDARLSNVCFLVYDVGEYLVKRLELALPDDGLLGILQGRKRIGGFVDLSRARNPLKIRQHICGAGASSSFVLSGEPDLLPESEIETFAYAVGALMLVQYWTLLSNLIAKGLGPEDCEESVRGFLARTEYRADTLWSIARDPATSGTLDGALARLVFIYGRVLSCNQSRRAYKNHDVLDRTLDDIQKNARMSLAPLHAASTYRDAVLTLASIPLSSVSFAEPIFRVGEWTRNAIRHSADVSMKLVDRALGVKFILDLAGTVLSGTYCFFLMWPCLASLPGKVHLRQAMENLYGKATFLSLINVVMGRGLAHAVSSLYVCGAMVWSMHGIYEQTRTAFHVIYTAAKSLLFAICPTSMKVWGQVHRAWQQAAWSLWKTEIFGAAVETATGSDGYVSKLNDAVKLASFYLHSVYLNVAPVGFVSQAVGEALKNGGFMLGEYVKVTAGVPGSTSFLVAVQPFLMRLAQDPTLIARDTIFALCRYPERIGLPSTATKACVWLERRTTAAIRLILYILKGKSLLFYASNLVKKAQDVGAIIIASGTHPGEDSRYDYLTRAWTAYTVSMCAGSIPRDEDAPGTRDDRAYTKPDIQTKIHNAQADVEQANAALQAAEAAAAGSGPHAVRDWGDARAKIVLGRQAVLKAEQKVWYWETAAQDHAYHLKHIGEEAGRGEEKQEAPGAGVVADPRFQLQAPFRTLAAGAFEIPDDGVKKDVFDPEQSEKRDFRHIGRLYRGANPTSDVKKLKEYAKARALRILGGAPLEMVSDLADPAQNQLLGGEENMLAAKKAPVIPPEKDASKFWRVAENKLTAEDAETVLNTAHAFPLGMDPAEYKQKMTNFVTETGMPREDAEKVIDTLRAPDVDGWGVAMELLNPKHLLPEWR